MNELLHTLAGLKNLGRMHSAIVVYVEGQDDKVFWSVFFEYVIPDKKFHFKGAGGYPQLTEYAKVVVESDEDTNIIIASDRHYDVLLNRHFEHPRIIYTIGFSIENSMYCPSTIEKCIRKHCRFSYTPNKIGEKWIKQFCEGAKELIYYDLANERFEKGSCLMGKTCDRFLTTKTPYISLIKVKEFLDEYRENISEDELKEAQRIIEESGLPLHKIIRGHFMTKGVINLIIEEARKKRGTRIKIPNESLFVETVDGCVKCNNRCDDFQEIKDACISTVSSINV